MVKLRTRRKKNVVKKDSLPLNATIKRKRKRGRKPSKQRERCVGKRKQQGGGRIGSSKRLTESSLRKNCPISWDTQLHYMKKGVSQVKIKRIRNALNSDLANGALNYGISFTLDKLNRSKGLQWNIKLWNRKSNLKISSKKLPVIFRRIILTHLFIFIK